MPERETEDEVIVTEEQEIADEAAEPEPEPTKGIDVGPPEPGTRGEVDPR